MCAHQAPSYVQVMEADRRPSDATGEPSAAVETGPTHYEIRLQGHLDARWAASFDGLSLSNDSDGTTVIRGPVVDQAALHGLLQKLRDVGVPLVSISQVDPDDPHPFTTEGAPLS
jgi:hypothetical protein